MPPRILLVAGKGTDSTSFGSTRYVLDQVYDIPYSVVDSQALDHVDLSGATAIVLPEGRGPAEKPAAEALKKFFHEMGAEPTVQPKLSVTATSLPAETTAVLLESRGKQA